MEIRVLFFGGLKELVGTAGESLRVAEAAKLGDVLRHYEAKVPRFADYAASLAMAVNQEYAGTETVLQAGDEVAFLPPVSGGAEDAARRAAIVREKIETESVVRRLKQAPDGAVVIFEGIVRDHTRGRRTLFLHYDAYEAMALKKMKELSADALEKFAVRDVAIVHRLGRLEIGETSVLIAVASAHRGAGFDACRWLIDTLKRTVPIWKKEHFEDGAVWADGEPFPEEIRLAKAPIREGLPSK
jgi:molybdopterin converting factor subunit 1